MEQGVPVKRTLSASTRPAVFLQLLDNRVAIAAILNLANVKRDLKIGKYLCNIFAKSTKLFEICLLCMRIELAQTKQEHLLFRSDSISTRILSLTMRTIGAKFLKKSLTPLVKLVDAYQHPTEIDPSFIQSSDPETDKKRLNTHRDNLLELCKTVLRKLTESIKKIDLEPASLLVALHDCVRQKFPNCASRSIGGFMFLRFIFPAFVLPENNGLISECNPALRRKLVLITKILQAIFNENIQRDEQWMNPVIPFIIMNIESNQKVYENLLVSLAVQKPLRNFKHYHLNESGTMISPEDTIDFDRAFPKLQNYVQSNCNHLLRLIPAVNLNSVEDATNEMRLILSHNDVRERSKLFDISFEIEQVTKYLKFLSWQTSSIQLDLPEKSKSEIMDKEYISKKLAFVSSPMGLQLLEKLCRFLITHTPSTKMCFNQANQPLCNMTLQLLDDMFNKPESEMLLMNYNEEVVLRAFLKCLQLQPIFRDKTHELLFGCLVFAMSSTDDPIIQMEQVFKVIPRIDKSFVPLVHSLFLLFDQIIRFSVGDPKLRQLSTVLLPLLFQTSSYSETDIEYCTSALEMLLIHIQDVLNTFPVIDVEKVGGVVTDYTIPSKLLENDWQLLFIRAETKRIPEGTVILQQGDENADLWYIQQGRVSIHKAKTNIVTLSNGQFLGEMSFIGCTTVSATVIAETECFIQRIPGEFVLQVLEYDICLFERFYGMIARIAADRFVDRINVLYSNVNTNNGNTIRISGDNMSPASSLSVPAEKSFKVQVFFSDFSSQWFTTHPGQTVQDFKKVIASHFNSGTNIGSSLESANLYFSNIDENGVRKFVALTDDWTSAFLQSIGQTNCIFYLTKIPQNKPSGAELEISLSTAFLVHQVQCKWKNKDGTLYVLPNHLVHTSKIFGHTSKKIFCMQDYDGVAIQDNIIVALKKNKKPENKQPKFRFVSEAEAQFCLRVIQSLHPNVATKKIQPIDVDDVPVNHAMALVNYTATHQIGISLEKSQIVEIIDPRGELWEVETTDKRRGWVPSNILHSIFIGKPPTTNQYHSLFQPRHFPTSHDWLKILSAGKTITYKSGEVIVRQGSTLQRFYQILHGECIVNQTLASGFSKPINVMKTDEVFGELSLIRGNRTTANVIAHSTDPFDNTVTVFMIEAENLHSLFTKDKRLAGSFFKYITSVVQQRTRNIV